MRYVVLGSMPATMKLVLSPGTMGSGEVSCQDGVGPTGRTGRTSNCRARARTVQSDQGVGHGADHRVVPTTRDSAVYDVLVDSPVVAL